MLALVAGKGRLPELLARALDRDQQKFEIFELEGQAADGLNGREVSTLVLEHLGSFLDTLITRGFTRVCFAGAIHRPHINPNRIDDKTLPILATIQQALGAGDDGALRIVVALFAQAGLDIVAAQEIEPALLPKSGVATKIQPLASHDIDIARAGAVISASGRLDMGQACVVAAGQVIGVEALPGTDFMLTSLKSGAGNALAQLPKGGILFKTAKPDQDRRVDLPTIGVGTVQLCHDAGLDGIVIGHGDVLVIDAPAVIAECDKFGLFLWVRVAD